jgi:hypothetical protein
MSIENHPNINAVGLQCAIYNALEKYVRGVAKEKNLHETPEIMNAAMLFAIDISDKLDVLALREMKGEKS